MCEPKICDMDKCAKMTNSVLIKLSCYHMKSLQRKISHLGKVFLVMGYWGIEKLCRRSGISFTRAKFISNALNHALATSNAYHVPKAPLKGF